MNSHQRRKFAKAAMSELRGACQSELERGLVDSVEDHIRQEKLIDKLQEQITELTRQRDLAVEAAQDAATSLETIHLRSYGEESYLDSRSLMRSYAGSRAKVARDAISAIKESEGSDGAVTRNA